MSPESIWPLAQLSLFAIFVAALWKVLKHFDVIRLNVRHDRQLLVGVVSPLIFLPTNLEETGKKHLRPFFAWLTVLVTVVLIMLAGEMFK